MNKVNILLIIMLLLTSFVYAGDIEPTNLSLDEAIKFALGKNPKILNAEKEYNAAVGRKLQMSAIPDIELEGEWVGEEGKIGLFQPLEFPGKRWLRSRVGYCEEKIAKTKWEMGKLLVTVDVKKVYYKVVLYEKIVLEIEKTIDLLKQFLEITNVKYSSGIVPYMEVIRAKVELAKVKNELIETRKELQIQKRELNLLLGRKSNEPFILTSDISYTPFNKDISEVKNEVMSKNNTLKIINLLLEKSQKSKSLSYMGLVPDFGSGLYKSRADKIDNWGVEFKINIPLYFWWKQTGQIKEAQAYLSSAEIILSATERNIDRAIEDTYESIKSSEEQAKNFKQILLPEVEDALKTGISNYQTGQIDALSLLDIYRTYKTTKIEYVKALYNYLSALADLEIAGEEKE